MGCGWHLLWGLQDMPTPSPGAISSSGRRLLPSSLVVSLMQAGILAFIHVYVHSSLCCATMPTFIHLCTDARNISGAPTVPGTTRDPEDRVVERIEPPSS